MSLPSKRRRECAASLERPGQSIHRFVVRGEDIDHLGHVNNAVYLQWTQAAVIGHWEALAEPEAVARYLWVALKHEITYRRPAFLGDDIVATVRLQAATGAKAQFETLIRRGEALLTEVSSLWCCIDRQTRRPVRLSKQTQARFVVPT